MSGGEWRNSQHDSTGLEITVWTKYLVTYTMDNANGIKSGYFTKFSNILCVFFSAAADLFSTLIESN